MDTQQLLTFQKLAKENSFKRASKELGISQPTVTMRIKALEEELGEVLVVRTGQRAILTPAGELFLSYVDRALKVYQSGIDRLIAGSEPQMLTIAGTATFNTYILPGALSSFQQDNTYVEWRIYTGSSDIVAQMIADEIADIGFVRGILKNGNALSYPLYAEEVNLIVPNGHPLAQRKQVAVQELKNEPILIYRRNSETWKLVEERFLHAGVQPAIAMDLEHVVAVKQMILAGNGIGFLPEATVREELSHGELQKVALDGPPIVLHTCVMLLRKTWSQEMIAFLRFLHRRFEPSNVPKEIAAVID